MDGSTQPSEADLRPEIELEELLDSFLRIEGIADPVRRQIAVLREAERYGLSVDVYSRLFALYARTALEQLNRSCVSMEGLHARGASLRGLRLDRCYGVPGGDFLGRWAPAVFRRQGAVLVGADLFRADLRGARLSGADLRNADLSNADLSGADLTRARLQGARLVGANLHGAVLHYAQLQGANLARADLRRADLFSTDLSGASLLKAWLDDRTVLERAEVRRAGRAPVRSAS